ncbi:MAG TPA: ATP-binding cassette domain-containing protein [Bacteroidia bacterium]|jgi:phospholipid/cholesterol/gamma-HCH transport system ATP-binding protein|nr:ATP-binding cassette domain-containing protein [Bacteroidia bacterium]
MNTSKEHSPVVVIKEVEKAFGENQVLKGFSLTVSKGENVVVLGRSGTGKSVLIKCIVRLVDPDQGSIHVLGTNMLQLKHDELDAMRAKIGFLFQSSALYDSMTVGQNLEFPLRRHRKKNIRTDEKLLVKSALESVGLTGTQEMSPAELSGGMRKRIGIARTLILNPEVMLYDEPTTGLDPITGREINRLMLDVQEKYNTSSIIISHDMNCVKMTANRVVVLIDGTCYAEGTYEELKRSQDKQVKQFFD